MITNLYIDFSFVRQGSKIDHKALKFVSDNKWYDPILLVNCSDKSFVSFAKSSRAWLKTHIPDVSNVIPYKSNNLIAYMEKPYDIYVGTLDNLTEAWNKGGGQAILHTEISLTQKRFHECMVGSWKKQKNKNEDDIATVTMGKQTLEPITFNQVETTLSS